MDQATIGERCSRTAGARKAMPEAKHSANGPSLTQGSLDGRDEGSKNALRAPRGRGSAELTESRKGLAPKEAAEANAITSKLKEEAKDVVARAKAKTSLRDGTGHCGKSLINKMMLVVGRSSNLREPSSN